MTEDNQPGADGVDRLRRRQGEVKPSRTVSLRLRLGFLAALAMTLVIAERTVSIVRLERSDLAAAERHVFEVTERGVSQYQNALVSIRTMLATLASDSQMTPEDAFSFSPGTDPQAPPPDPGLTPSTPEICSRLGRVLEVVPVADSLAVTAANGIVRCGTSPNAEGLDLSGRDYFRIAMRGIPSIDTVARSFVTGLPSVYAAQPLVAPGGRVAGVLVARVNIRELFPLEIASELGPGAEMMIVDPAGRVMITYPEDPTLIGREMGQKAFVAPSLSRTSGTVTAQGPDGVRRIYGYSRLPSTNMHLLVGVDERTILTPIERATFQAGMTLLLASCIIFLGLWIAGERLIVAPVRALANRLVRFGRGEAIETERAPTLITEIQPLAVAFESMTEELTRRENALRSANRRLSSLASLDPLTGIANRRSFDAVAALQWGTASQIAMLILDIDHFKKFNDRYGHKEGDDCIRRLAQALASTVRGTDIVARIGGEEFAVLMPGATIEAACDVAERLRAAVEKLAIPHDGLPAGFVSISVGCAACRPEPEITLSDLFVAADRALYEAKAAGRNAVRCAPSVRHEPDPEAAIVSSSDRGTSADG
ncbi:sensor domain-containing diguanylate cyclase [Ancylobacter mangrovi]|uniref:sensor domain-containing diguanylate cyclase n=1 Tax=Ancylobacter mangrovi TaxID=2972472 RepID=UPI0021632DE6|nr:diguanylate cyclase [Ancylobacter mangrovi]MCS0502537.1 diguanylate cyclase [Ancylobacter mangrovi]